MTDWGRDRWPVAPFQPYTVPYTTPQPITVERVPTQDEWNDFLELVRKAEAYDTEHGEPHCEKPDVEAWMEAIGHRLSRLEKQPRR